MDKKKIVIALGGNALGNTLSEQFEAVKTTAKAIVDLVEEGHQVTIVHGNGPQVGMINNAMDCYAKSDDGHETMPLSVCVAMSQAYIGYDLQNAIRAEFAHRNLDCPALASIVTQVRVDADDPAFKNPSKPIGQFMSEDEAKKAAAEHNWDVKEDAGRGWRRVVASPLPKEIVELDAINAMLNDGSLVICCGGGGIPVVEKDGGLAGASAVIDKDASAALLAESLDADMLIILTAVEKVAINFGKPNQEDLNTLTCAEAQQYIDEEQFAAGSMLPKVQAGMRFAQSGEGRKTLITLLEKARDGINGKTGTVITK